ncbi:MAG: NUDIX domain-containing protein [Candidatus Omnitrophica bacterium]|nr:NUDIX domain-containing protein [Candidatus Omnitrophota bacterium]
MKTKPYFLSVKALVKTSDDLYLLLQRSATSKNHPGYWEFPGGKIDPGESFDVALEREIKEETGLTVSLIKVMGSAESEIIDRRIAYIIMQADVEGPSDIQLSEEHDDFKWVAKKDIDDFNLCPQFIAFAQGMKE